MIIRYVCTRPGARMPVRASEGSAGHDLFACLEEAVTLPPGGRALIPTGIALSLPGRETVGLVYARSGLAARHGLALANGVGVIDSDYTGEVQVALVNLGDAPYTVRDGDRVAQLVVTPVLLPVWEEAASLEETARGAGGFGSTGKA